MTKHNKNIQLGSQANSSGGIMDYRLFSVRAFEYLVGKLDPSIYSEIDFNLMKINLDNPNFFPEIISNVSGYWSLPPNNLRVLNLEYTYDVNVEVMLKKRERFPISRGEYEYKVQIKPRRAINGELPPCHLVLSLYGNKFQESFLIPIPYILKECEGRVTAENSYQQYKHSFLPQKAKQFLKRSLLRSGGNDYEALNKYLMRYIGITSRTWQVREAEHVRAAKRGSPLLFHKQIALYLREPKNFIGIEHEVLRVGLTAEEADSCEEYDVERTSLAANFPDTGLNMIPGGKSGWEYLKMQGASIFAKKNSGKTYSELCLDYFLKAPCEEIKSISSGKKISSNNAGVNTNRTTSTKPYDRFKDKILNQDSIEKFLKSVKKYNDSLKKGDDPAEISLTKPVYHHNLKGKNFENEISKLKEYLKMINKNELLRKNNVELIYLEDTYLWNKTVIQINHSCNKKSYILLEILRRNFENGDIELISCSNRDCYQKITGVKLQPNSHMPSRIGIKPRNTKRVDDINKYIVQKTNGDFEMVEETYRDVRKPFLVRVSESLDCDFKYLYVSSHDNYTKRVKDGADMYHRHWKTLKNRKQLHSNVKTFSSIKEYYDHLETKT